MTSAERAIVLALIIHELVSNSFRHGASRGTRDPHAAKAPGDEEGAPLVVSASIRTVENEIQIVVEDNGRGLPPGFQLGKDRNLGLSVVELLVQRDLEGQFSITDVASLSVSERGVRAQVRATLHPDDEILEIG